MSGPVPEQNPDTAYLDKYACAVGRLFGNLLSLEMLLRLVLYELRDPPHTPFPPEVRFGDAKPGETLPLNAITGWDTLGQLIERYNRAHAHRGRDALVDTSLKDVRDAFAHGRILADNPPSYLRLIRFSKPASGLVTVERVQPLPIEWVLDQLGRVRTEIAKVEVRLREFPSQHVS